MAAAIEVVHGPAAGWKYDLGSAEVRVGRGAGHQMRVEDPAWGGGHLRVLFRNGGYVVANRMGHVVLLGGRKLDDGGEDTWFTGDLLQPTGGTLLQLVAAGMTAVATDPAEVAGKKRARNWAAVGLVAAAVAAGGAKQYLRPVPPSDARVLQGELRRALAAALPSERGKEIADAMQNGMICQSRGEAAAARRWYVEARLRVDDAAGPGPAGQQPAALQDALRFVAAREREIAADAD